MIHQYKNNGYNIVMDVNSGSVHVVDDIVYDMIPMVEPLVTEGVKDADTIKAAVLALGNIPYPEEEIKEAVDEVLELEKPDFLCHMGDLEGSADYIREIAGCPLAMVSGNNDFFCDLNPEVTFELEGFRIFMTHGHYYYVHSGTERLFSAGRRNGANIVLFGHTHQPTLEVEKDLIVANPGSLTYPRQAKRRPSYMLLYLEKGKVPNFETKYL